MGYWSHPVSDTRRRRWTHLTRIAHHQSTAASDPATLTELFLTFDLDVTRHAVARKSVKKFRHSNRLHRLATIRGERCGLGGQLAARASGRRVGRAEPDGLLNAG